jgi:hypothetical protein
VLRGDYADYRQAMRELFNQVDPMALIDGGAPEDEYDPEIGDLLRWRKPVTSQDISSVFERWFSTSIASEDAARLAAGIARIRADYGYEVG